MMAPAMLMTRSAAVTAAAVACAIVLAVVVTPTVALFAGQSQDIEDARQQLAAYRSDIAREPQLAAQLKFLKESSAAIPSFFTAASPELAAAQLESDVKTIVESNRGTVQSAQIIPPQLLPSPDAVAVQYDLTVPVSHLQNLVYAIETHSPYLFIDHVDIRAPQDWLADKAAGAPPLAVRWTIRGIRWTAAK